ncbi:Nuclear import receptor [Blastocladiella emersonii ATCC 22665]|nr:Nuclear import receptor [Blastocladiella emersonii ATCC 22665]
MSAEYFNAVSTLYGATDQTARKAAEKWLQDFELTDDAWGVATAVLSAPPGGPNGDANAPARIFASQVLRHKVARDLYKLSNDHVTQLRSGIVQMLSTPALLDARAVTQLCCALADMAIHVPAWTAPVSEVTQALGQRADLFPVFLEFLTVLPQELAAAERVMTRAEYAERMASLVEANAAQVFRSLVTSLQGMLHAADPRLHTKLFACVESWMDTHAIPLNDIVQSQIIAMSFDALASSDVAESAASILSAVFDLAEPDITHQSAAGTAVVQVALPRLIAAAPLIHEAADDEDSARSMVRLVTAAGVACLGPIAERPVDFAPLLDLAVSVMAFPHLDVLNQTFDFWNMLTIAVHEDQLFDSTPIVSAYQRLLGILIRQMRFAEDYEDLTAKEKEDFSDFRHFMGDVVKDCCSVLGVNAVLSHCLDLLGQATAASSTTSAWRDVEAVLAGARAIGRFANEANPDNVRRLIEALPGLMAMHPRVNFAGLVLIGCYSPWTHHHPEFLAQHMDLVSRGFSGDTECVAAAARTLMFMAKDSAPLMHQYIGQLHPFYLTALGSLPLKESLDVVEAVSHIIAAAPVAEMPQLLQQFATPLVQQLDPSLPVPTLKETLYRLAMIIKTVKPAIAAGQPHPILGLVDALWPYLQGILAVHARTDPVTEGVSKVIRNTLNDSCIPHYSADQLTRLVDLLAAQFAATQFSCWLWVANHVVSNFSRDAQWVAPLLQFVQQLTQTTAAMAERDGWDAAFETIDEMHGIFSTVLGVLPAQFLAWSPTLDNIVQFSLQALQHSTNPHTVGSLLYFFRALLDQLHPLARPAFARQGVDTAEIATRVVRPHAGNLLGITLAKRIADLVGSESFSDVMDIIKFTAEIFPAEFVPWCTQCLGMFSFLTQAERQSLLALFARVQPENSMSSVRDAVNKIVMLHQRRSGHGTNSSRRRRN